jgi:hypothetical protein
MYMLNCPITLHKKLIMTSSGILRRVTLAGTNVSEESIASIIRVRRIAELGIMLAVTGN